MLTRKNDSFFVSSKRLLEATDDGSHMILSLHYARPGEIAAFISPEVHQGMDREFRKNPNLDAVLVTASLSSLVSEALAFFEDDAPIDQWLNSLEQALEQLRSFKKQRREVLESTLCELCLHPALDHYVPHVGDLNCRRAPCGCEQFSPLVRLTSVITAGLSR